MSDFSCYIQITNNSAHQLSVNYESQSGAWRGDLPSTIAAHATVGYLQLEDPYGPHGSQGSIALGIVGTNASVTVYLEDPYSGDNSVYIQPGNFTPTMSFSYEGATGDPSGFEPGNLPSGGHPVYVNATFADSATG